MALKGTVGAPLSETPLNAIVEVLELFFFETKKKINSTYLLISFIFSLKYFFCAFDVFFFELEH